MKNKKGWIRIVEVFVAVLLIAGVVLTVINQRNADSIGQEGVSDISEEEISILREIQLSQNLRESVISTSPLPANWEDAWFPSNVKDKINSRFPGYLECQAKICSLKGGCLLSNSSERDVYSNSIIITVNPDQEGSYSPKKLKIFCWEK